MSARATKKFAQPFYFTTECSAAPAEHDKSVLLENANGATLRPNKRPFTDACTRREEATVGILCKRDSSRKEKRYSAAL